MADPDAIEVIRPYQINTGGDSTGNAGNGNGNGNGENNGASGVNNGQGAGGAPENDDAAARAAREAADAAAAAAANAAAAGTSAAQPAHQQYYIAAMEVGYYPGDEGVPPGRHSPTNKDTFPLYTPHPLSGIGAAEDGDAHGTPFIDDRTKWKKWYEYTAYYVPIIQWLPKYKCADPRTDGN
jgi:hypothetical protein